MTFESSRSLGHGVRVVPGDGREVVVLSEKVDFEWRARERGRPGSAVIIDGEVFEAIARQPWGRGARWILEPWSGEDVMRVTAPLDEAAVAEQAARVLIRDRATRLRPAMWLLAPILGFAIAAWQRRWRDQWGFPASTATWISAILEMLFGAACLIETIAAMGAGASVFQWIPRPVVTVGVYFFVEGVVRLAMVFSDSEPAGSLLGAVVSIFERRREPVREPVPGPEVEALDEETGILELRSPVLRRDWEEPGALPFRGESFVLDGARQLGESWIYRFRRTAAPADEGCRSLRLSPPRPKIHAVVRDEAPGLVKTVLLSIACTMAPGRFQKRWAWWVGTPAGWFTICGSTVELFGGVVNLNEGAAGLFVGLNLFLVAEAVVRLTWLRVKKEPMGSVLGMPLTPVLEMVLPD